MIISATYEHRLNITKFCGVEQILTLEKLLGFAVAIEILKSKWRSGFSRVFLLIDRKRLTRQLISFMAHYVVCHTHASFTYRHFKHIYFLNNSIVIHRLQVK